MNTLKITPVVFVRRDDAIMALADLIQLALQYASECGECAGTRVQPDDTPCTECAFIWTIIDRAEAR